MQISFASEKGDLRTELGKEREREKAREREKYEFGFLHSNDLTGVM